MDGWQGMSTTVKWSSRAWKIALPICRMLSLQGLSLNLNHVRIIIHMMCYFLTNEQTMLYLSKSLSCRCHLAWPIHHLSQGCSETQKAMMASFLALLGCLIHPQVQSMHLPQWLVIQATQVIHHETLANQALRRLFRHLVINHECLSSRS